METTHRGRGIIWYSLKKYGAILLVSVPDTIRRSVCFGAGRKRKPNRSMSYRLEAAWIISTAQQASPKVRGQTDPTRSQPTSVIRRSEAQSSPIWAHLVLNLGGRLGCGRPYWYTAVLGGGVAETAQSRP
jgi:hypothetical protein